MDHKKKPDISPPAPVVPAGPTPCAVCGGYDGEMAPVGNARSHEACAAARPDVIAKVKARA